MSKGSTQRPTDKKRFDDNYDAVFGLTKVKDIFKNQTLEWYDAPSRTTWGDGMRESILSLDKDSIVRIFAHEDDLHKVAAVLKGIV